MAMQRHGTQTTVGSQTTVFTLAYRKESLSEWGGDFRYAPHRHAANRSSVPQQQSI